MHSKNHETAQDLFARIQWQREHPGVPFPKTPEEWLSYTNRNTWQNDLGDWMLRLMQPGMLDTRYFKRK